jgi:peptidoglycan DL-endopeptidase LytE
MRKLVLSILTAGALVFSGTSFDAQATNIASPAQAPVEVEQVSSAKATAKSGTFKTKFNSNIRADAGTKFKVVTVAKKGATVTATHQKKVGSSTWFKVKVNGKSGWVLSTLLTPAKASVTKASSSVSNSGVVATGLALRGTPYRFGGTTKAGFDCSGFVQYVFKQNGKNVSRSTLGQFAETKTVSSPQPGDLVFFANTYRPGISHVGIYIGNNQFVHSGGRSAEVISLNNSYWGPKFHSFKRY